MKSERKAMYQIVRRTVIASDPDFCLPVPKGLKRRPKTFATSEQKQNLLYQAFRKRNSDLARKYRQKKREMDLQLQERIARLEAENNFLKEEAKRLRLILAELKKK